MTSQPQRLRTHSIQDSIDYRSLKNLIVEMGGKSKKKSTAKKGSSQNPPKYVVTPASPAKTRSGAAKDQSASESAEPTLAVTETRLSAVAQAAEGATASPLQVSLEDLGARMAQMESAVRSVLTSASTASPPTSVGDVSSAPAPSGGAEKRNTHRELSHRSSRRVRRDSESQDLPGHRRHRRRRTRDSRSASSSSSSSSSSSNYSWSSDESTSSSRSTHKGSRRSRRKQEKRDKKRKGKFDTSKFLKEGDKLNTYERLVLANLKMVRKFYKKDRDILGFLDHMILVAEKAERKVFSIEALINYDEAVKASSKEYGLRAFKTLDPANIVKHLSYDGTQVAVNSRRPNANRPSATKTPNLNHNFACIKFNFAQGGCKERSCRYKHICSACSG